MSVSCAKVPLSATVLNERHVNIPMGSHIQRSNNDVCLLNNAFMKLQVSQPHTKPVVAPNIISSPCDTEEPALQRNRGHGAGGKNTTVNGAAFEQHCSFEKALEDLGFCRFHFGKKSQKTSYCYQRLVFPPYESYPRVEMYFTQQGFGHFVKTSYECEASIHADPSQCLLWSLPEKHEFLSGNKPDAAFLIIDHLNVKTNEADVTLNIIEMKTQKVAGSVDIKLHAGANFRRSYELDFPNWYIRYAFYIEKFLEDKYAKNWKHIRTILKDDAIPCFMGSDPSAQRAILDYVGIFPQSE